MLEALVGGGAVGATILNGLLQGWLLSCMPSYSKHCVADLRPSPLSAVDSSGFPQIYQRDDGSHLQLGVLLPGFSSQDHLRMTVNAREVELIGEMNALETPSSAVVDSGACSGPFGAFQRSVRLSQPIDASTPVDVQMKHGIVEYRFLKGFSPLSP